MAEYLDYPDRYALTEVLGGIIQRRELEQFAQSQGIFIANASRDDMADFLSSLMYDHEQLEKIRRSALHITETKTLIGFVVTITDEDRELVSAIERERQQASVSTKGMKVGPVVQIQDGESPVYRGTIDYRQHKPGRIQFLQGTDRSFEYYLHRIGSEKWRVVVDCSSSNDGRIMEDWIDRSVARSGEMLVIRQELLSTDQTVRFFDRLGSEGGGEGWSFSHVKRIVLRRNRPSDEEADELELEQSMVAGITQAILEGNDLRDNPFVKQCENDGYLFTAMTYEYEHRSTPYIKQIRAEFKQRPKVFEVALMGYHQTTGTELQRVAIVPDDDKRVNILMSFWNTAQTIYQELLRETPVV